MSPIKGLTTGVLPSFPRLGKLRKGSEAKDKTVQTASGPRTIKTYGADLEYFRFTAEGKRVDIQTAFEAVYGDQPALLHVFLPHPGVEENFGSWKEKWVAGGLVHRCDGELMTLWRDEAGKIRQQPKPCPYFGVDRTAEQEKADPPCKEVGRLSLIVPELVYAGLVGYVVLETHSKNDLASIQAALLAAAEARGDNPLGLRGIEFVLKRELRTISTPSSDGKRARRDKWMVVIEPAADWVRLQLDMAHRLTMGLPEPAKMIASSTEETPEVEEADFDEIPDIEDETLEAIEEEIEQHQQLPSDPQATLAPEPKKHPAIRDLDQATLEAFVAAACKRYVATPVALLTALSANRWKDVPITTIEAKAVLDEKLGKKE